ncbi:MAG: long-chain fatty acid--CoA ligase [Flavipsychrobacter sp.]
MERLFDIVSARAKNNPEETLLAAKENGTWRKYSCKEVMDTANALTGGIISLGIANSDLTPEHQEKIAIIAPNRPEWIITDIAVQQTGAVLTPLYPTISTADMEYILTEADVHIVFIANEELYERFKPAFDNTASVKHVYSFDKVAGVPNWQELIDKGASPDDTVINKIKKDTLATIIYTSGTTGNPKGVMLTHDNIVSNVRDCVPIFTFVERGKPALSFLPLNHIFERMVSYIFMRVGVPIYYAESMDTIGDNLKEVKPFVFTTVPRLLEKVYEKIVAKGMELKGIKRALFFWALSLGDKYDNVNTGSWWYRFQLKIANKLIFSKWREALGNNVKAIVSGSAACQPRLIRVFTAAGIIIKEGYGLTETSPVISVNTYESEGRRIGTVGRVINNVSVKLAEDGEILCKGPNVMLGYYKQPELTKDVFTADGYLKTGDIGEWVEGSFLKITDRKKEIFKTSGGKYVAPQVVENKMKESPFIEQMIVIGANRKFVTALIVPSFININKWLTDHGQKAASNNNDLVNNATVIELIQKQIDKYNATLGHVEQVKKFTLLPNEWTVDGGELTPTIKIKRKQIQEKYAAQIEALYN